MNHRSTIDRLIEILTPLRGTLAISILCRLINQSLGIALISLAIWGLVRVAIFQERSLILTFALTLAGLGAVKGVFRYLEQFTGHYVAFRLLADLRHRLFRSLERLGPAGLSGTHSGDLVSRAIADIDRMEVFYAHTIAPAAVAAVVPAGTLVVISLYNPPVAWVLLPFLLAVGLLIPWLAHRIGSEPAAQVRSGLAEISTHFTDSLQGVREILIFGCENQRAVALDRLGRQVSLAQRGVSRCGAFQLTLTEIMIGMGALAVLFVAGRQVLAGQLAAGDLAVVFALALCSFVPLLGISNLIPDYEQAIRSAQRLFDILDLRPRVLSRYRSSAKPRRFPAEGAAFRNVVFRYEAKEAPVLDGVTFVVPPRQIVALVGESGAGKSTIAQLLLALRFPESGTIEAAGLDFGHASPENIRKLVTAVPQEIHLFNTTIRENLLVANPRSSQSEIEAAADLAQMHDFIRSLPKGYNTPLQEWGTRFSGGQRQRLAIARAFLRRPALLILDEASAHLDAENESLILDSLRCWVTSAPAGTPNRSVLLVSHRPAWVQEADYVHVLEHGKIIQSGLPHLLSIQEGLYADLFAESWIDESDIYSSAATHAADGIGRPS